MSTLDDDVDWGPAIRALEEWKRDNPEAWKLRQELADALMTVNISVPFAPQCPQCSQPMTECRCCQACHGSGTSPAPEDGKVYRIPILCPECTGRGRR